MALIRASMFSHLQRRSLLLPARIAAFSCSAPCRSQEDPDRKFSNKTRNRLLEDAPFKAYQQKGGQLEHFAQTESVGELVPSSQKEVKEYTLPHPIWSQVEVESVTVTHRRPVGFTDHLAYYVVAAMRLFFDIFSGYKLQLRLGTLDERAVLVRCIFLETVAGVPGFAAGMIRHLNSLRNMERDHGWIHTLLEEAENERMHLMTFMQLRHPGPVFRFAVITTQMLFTAGFTLAYLISPHFCHRFVGYLEEQAVVTYTEILSKMDEGRLPMWSVLPAPQIAVKYWKLEREAKMRDVILAIRADEAHHRVVNHTLGDLNSKNQNPFGPGE